MDTNQIWHEAPNHTERVPHVLARESQDQDARVVCRRVSVDVREVDIQRDERATSSSTGFGDVDVGMSIKPLFEDGRRIQRVRPEDRSHLDGKVLVGFDGRHVPTSGSGTRRSRVNSAACCTAAWISSRLKDG